jgi:hypothetical protein
MNEKQMREAIIERMEFANAKELSLIWHFVRALIDPAGREGQEKK